MKPQVFKYQVRGTLSALNFKCLVKTLNSGVHFCVCKQLVTSKPCWGSPHAYYR